MILRLFLAAFLAALISPSAAQTRLVWMETTYGPMQLSLDETAAPITVANFMGYVNDGFFDDLIFHRIIPGFVVQSGTFESDLGVRTPTRPAIASERNNGLSNVPGTVAMALAGNPPITSSAQAAWFINTGVNTSLDSDFTVFGEVTAGQSTLDAMNAAPRMVGLSGNITLFDFPVEPPRIIRMFETQGYPVAPLHTGSWREPDVRGRGINIEVANGGISGKEANLVIYLYDFTGGTEFWAVGNVPFDFGPSSLTVPMFTVEGPETDVPFDPQPWGTIMLEVTGCDSAVMTFDSPEFGSGTRPLIRTTRPNEIDSCDGL